MSLVTNSRDTYNVFLGSVVPNHRANLSDARILLTLLSYPIVIIFIWDRTGSRWIREHRSFILPAELREQAERNGLRFIFVKYTLLLVVLFLLAHEHPWRLVEVGPQQQSWARAALLGLAGGCLLLLCKTAFVIGSPVVALLDRTHPTLKGAASLWVAVFIGGGFAEALWLALCVNGLQQSGSSPISAAVITAASFAIARVAGTPSRIQGSVATVGAEVVLGFVLGMIFVWAGNVMTLWIASVVYNAVDFWWLRWRYHRPELMNRSTN